MNHGTIPHALYVTANCDNGVLNIGVDGSGTFTGTSATPCSGGTGPPIGARLQLKLTDSQINALTGLQPWEYAVLHAMHDYGIYVLDTCNCGESLGAQFESQTQYYAYTGNLNDYPGYNVTNLSSTVGSFAKVLNWSQDFQVVDPCYALENCQTYP